MKIYQLRDLSTEELAQKKHELEEELFNLRLTILVKKLDNPMRIRNLRKDIARINTLLREAELKTQKVTG
jgi:large subunit ribosomal protein L29